MAVVQPVDTTAFRPQMLADVVGQTTIKKHLAVYMASADARGQVLDHVLLSGPKGLGKTTLAYVIANETGGTVRETIGKALGNSDLAGFLDGVGRGDVVFIDEIHSVHHAVQEQLYPVMEDSVVSMSIPGFRPMRITLPKVTVIGATTNAGQVAAPMRDRFGINLTLQFYSPEDLATIAARDVGLLGGTCDEEVPLLVGRCSRGTPRIAKRLTRRMYDFAVVLNDGHLDEATALSCLEDLGIDSTGLDSIDRRILQCIYGNNGRAAFSTIKAYVALDTETLRDVHESFLLQEGFMAISPRGRVLTEKGEALVT
jgi:Holliday junction DNA helicase RuvB